MNWQEIYKHRRNYILPVKLGRTYYKLRISIDKWNPEVKVFLINDKFKDRVKFIWDYDLINKICNLLGVEIQDVKVGKLDIQNQFTGKITDPNTNLFINETLTLNVYKTDNSKIGNILNVYAFHSKTLSAVWLMLERQFIQDGNKIVRTKGVLISNNLDGVLASCN